MNSSGECFVYSDFMQRPTTQQWLMMVASLVLVIGIVWGQFWRPGLLICAGLWLVLVFAGLLWRRRNPG
jgi:hypothetical protein